MSTVELVPAREQEIPEKPGRFRRRPAAPGKQPRSRRLSEWRPYVAGWRDGRRGLPVLHNPSYPSGYLRSIQQQLFQEVAQERVAFEDADGALSIKLATLEQRIALEREDLRRSEAALIRVRDEYELSSRRLGEHSIDDELVRLRRRREFEARERQIHAAYRQETERLNESLTQRRKVLAERVSLRATVGARLERSISLLEQRLALYLRGAQRTHPNPSELVARSGLFMLEPGWSPSADIPDGRSSESTTTPPTIIARDAEAS